MKKKDYNKIGFKASPLSKLWSRERTQKLIKQIVENLDD